MAFGFVLVLESIVAELACVLLLHLVHPKLGLARCRRLYKSGKLAPYSPKFILRIELFRLLRTALAYVVRLHGGGAVLPGVRYRVVGAFARMKRFGLRQSALVMVT